MEFICPICKKEFFSYNKRRKTCSKQCTAINQREPVRKKCNFCGKEIIRTIGNFRYKMAFCNRRCQHDWEKIKRIRFSQLRNKEWCLEKYKEHSLREIADILGCGETTVYKFFKTHGIKLDRKQWLRGERHYAWKNGITILYRAIRTCSENLKWRESVWESNLHQCALCGSTEELEVDHVKKFKFILIDNKIKTLDNARKCKELWNINNGRILCRKCNKIDCNLNRKTYPTPNKV